MCLVVYITVCRNVLVSELEECTDREIGVYLWGVCVVIGQGLFKDTSFIGSLTRCDLV